LELSEGNGYGERLKESQVYWFGSDEVYGYYSRRQTYHYFESGKL